MTIQNPLMPPLLGLGSIPNVVPFTMRENFSQMGLVEGMRVWIETDLVPFINNNLDTLSITWIEQANKLIVDFEAITVALVSQVGEAVEGIDASVSQAEASRLAAEAARDLAEQFASDAQEIQDASVTVIVNDVESQLHAALNQLFAPLAQVTLIHDLVTTGRLSIDTLNERFDAKADGAAVAGANQALHERIDDTNMFVAGKAPISLVDTVDNGRLSQNTLDAAYASKPGVESLAQDVATIPRDGLPVLVPGKKYRTMACVIRRVNSTTWEFIDDANHSPLGTASISMTSSYVLVTTDFVGKVVATCSVTPDETFSQSAVRVGASVGLSSIRVYFYMGAAGSAPVNPGLLSAVGANVWVYGIWEVA